MQLKRKGKGLLYLIAIAVVISIVFIACSEKPTGMNDFETDIIDISDDIANKEPSTPPKTDTGDNNKTQALTQDEIDKLSSSGKIYARDFLGYYFENGDFKAQVMKIDNYDAIKLKGTDASSNPVNRIYYMSSAQNAHRPNDTYRTFLCSLKGNESVKTEATFSDGGYLTLKLKNSNNEDITLKLSLTKKAKDGTTDLIG